VILIALCKYYAVFSFDYSTRIDFWANFKSRKQGMIFTLYRCVVYCTYTANYNLTRRMILKKFIFLFSFIFTVLQVSAQRSNEVADKAIESIVGRWELQKVYAGSREITSNPNSENSAWIEFNEDGTYRQQVEGIEQGSYRLNENHSVLYLESEQRKETSSAVSLHNLTEYNISMRDGVLTMQSRSENTGPTKYVYARATAQSETDNK
jgi:hypothetical protein